MQRLGALPTAELIEYGARAAGVLILVIQLSLIPLVLIRRKEASSIVAWILTLVFIPLLGAFLFLLFGRDRVRIGASRKRRAKAETRERMRGKLRAPSGGLIAGPVDPSPDGPAPSSASMADSVALAFADAELEARLSLLDQMDRPIFRVGGKLGHMAATSTNVISVMNEGTTAIDAKFEAIERATESVHAQYYLVRDDVTGQRFLELLIAAAARGCRVRLLVDGFGGRPVHRHAGRLRKAGVELAYFLPIRALGAGLHPRVLGAFQWNLRNHRKILVIDGRLGFTGGVNIGDDVRAWRDTHVRLEGPAVHSLQALFLEDWEFATERAVADLADFPSFVPELASDEASHERAPSRSHGIVEVVASGPDTATEAIHRVFFAAITGARSRVYITTPYFVPDRAMIVALQTAALGGVDVKMIVPARSNHLVTAAAGRSYYEEILESGVGVYEYLPGMIHAKTIVVDGRIALVGSANMDMRSFRLNYEVHAVIRDDAVAARLERTFDEDLGQTRRLDLYEWRRRGVWARVVEGGGRLVAPLL